MRSEGKPKPERQFRSLSELARTLGRDYRTIHRAVQASRIKTVRFGSMRLIPQQEFERVLKNGW
jgi:excisionase family DNA binding protein